MKKLKQPYYVKDITGSLESFDDRNTGFSRGAAEGDLYTAMHDRSVANIRKVKTGKTICDHAMWVAGRTVDYMTRRYALARDEAAIYNRRYRLKDPDPAAMAAIVKDMARWFGADLVGIAKVNPAWIYSHWGLHNTMYSGAAQAGDPVRLPATYNRAIVMIHEMDYDRLRRSPAVEPETDIAYSKMGWCASSLATFIRELGYHAIPSGNDMGLNIPLAVDAGLGELGRMGLLLTREFGPRVRISKVFTDLPLDVDAPVDIGVQQFCEKCGICAQHCPSQAIMKGPKTDRPWDRSNAGGLKKWPIQAMRCFNWWVANGTHCSVCIRVCPWNKRNDWLHAAVRVMAERDLFTRLIVRLDQWLGFGRQVHDPRFDLQDRSVIEVTGASENENRPNPD